MASSANKQGNTPAVAHGTFTSASTAAAEVITIGWDPEYVEFHMNQEGTNVDIVKSWNGATSSTFLTGSTGVTTTPANEVTYNGDGTITVSATPQTNSGVNYWFAFKG